MIDVWFYPCLILLTINQPDLSKKSDPWFGSKLMTVSKCFRWWHRSTYVWCSFHLQITLAESVMVPHCSLSVRCTLPITEATPDLQEHSPLEKQTVFIRQPKGVKLKFPLFLTRVHRMFAHVPHVTDKPVCKTMLTNGKCVLHVF